MIENLSCPVIYWTVRYDFKCIPNWTDTNSIYVQCNGMDKIRIMLKCQKIKSENTQCPVKCVQNSHTDGYHILAENLKWID